MNAIGLVVYVLLLLIPGTAACLLFAVLVYVPVRWMLIRRGWRVKLDVIAVGIAGFGVWMAASVPVVILVMMLMTDMMWT